MNSINKKSFRTIELFAGAGGLALGVEKAGFETIGLIEIDKDAACTLLLNKPNWNVISRDIAEVSKWDLTDFLKLKRENWNCCPAAHRASLFRMQEKDWD